jgi:hypothetical protein
LLQYGKKETSSDSDSESDLTIDINMERGRLRKTKDSCIGDSKRFKISHSNSYFQPFL